MENQRIADHLDDIADLLELEEGNEFRVRAYRTAARKVRELEDFGAKTERNILEGIDEQAEDAGRTPLKAAQEYVDSLDRHLDGLDSVSRWEIAGSFRRRKETVGDLDIIVHTGDRERAIDDMAAFEGFDQTVSRGAEKATLQLDSGLRVDFRFFEPRNFGAALMYFTGSKPHNVALRRIARERDWKLNEYGLSKDDQLLAARDEESIYHRLNLDWVPPELREDRGEVDAAAAGELPDLVTLDDIRGDLHCHTRETDGEDRSEADMTRRLLRAVESGVIHCLGHPECRQIGRRDGVSFAAEDVFAACAEHGVALEINANPTRLDLPDTYARLARVCGARLVINTDAHRVNDLRFMRFGIDVARRGWLRAADVLNTGKTEQILRHRRKVS